MEFSGSPYVPPGYRAINFELVTPVYPQPTPQYLSASAGLALPNQVAVAIRSAIGIFTSADMADGWLASAWSGVIGCVRDLEPVTSSMRERAKESRMTSGAAASLAVSYWMVWSAVLRAECAAIFSYPLVKGVYGGMHSAWGEAIPLHHHRQIVYLHAVPHVIPHHPLWPVYIPPAYDNIIITLPGSGELNFAPVKPVPVTFAGSTVSSAWKNPAELDCHTHIRWAWTGGSIDSEWGKPDPEPDPPPTDPDPPLPDHSPSHTIMNNVQILSLPDNIPLHGTVQLELDTDSYCWSGSITLSGRENLPHLKPTAAGPRELQITINGYRWLVFVNNYTRTRQYPAETYVVSINSRHRQFGSDWAPRTDGAVTANIRALALIDQLLGNTGFTITQSANSHHIKTPDWTIAAGSVGWVGQHPIDVISDIVKSAGAILVPHPHNDSWQMQPAYPVSPWALSDAPLSALSHVIPVGLDMHQGMETNPGQSHDSVLISGVQHGVAVNVRRAGTAGNAPAEDVYHDLHQDVQQCLEHGRNVLAAAGTKSLFTISLPIMPSGTAPELVMPGTLAGYEDPEHAEENWRGVVKSLSVIANGAADVTQNVTVEVMHG